MKKFLMPFMLLLVAVVTISSCSEEEEVDMTGFYTGNVKTNSQMKVIYPGVLNLDTTFSTLDATAELSVHDNADSINLEIKLSLNGTPIKIKVPAYKTSENTISITNYAYKYLVVNMIVNGSGTVEGNELTANIKLANGTGNPTGTDIAGDLTFVGTK